MTHKIVSAIVTGLLLALVTACGGGGGDGGGGSSSSSSSSGGGNSPPAFTSESSASVPEGQVATGYTVTAEDPDGDSVSFSIAGGADQGAFSIDSSSGVLSFITAPDFDNPGDGDADNIYIVEIEAADGNGGTATMTLTVNVTAESAPVSAPSGLTAEAESWNSVRLDWDDNADNEIGFAIERSEDGGSTFEEVGDVGSDVTSHVDSNGLAGSTNYTYRVLAYNGLGPSDFSNVVSVTTPAESVVTLPNAPSGLGATPSNHHEIQIEWTDNSDNEDGFIVERRTSATDFSELVRIEPDDGSGETGGGSPPPPGDGSGDTGGGSPSPPDGIGGSAPEDAATDTLAYTDVTVLDSTTYTYRVRAFNAAGDSEPSNEAQATTPAAPEETFELSLAVTGGGSGNASGPGLDCGSTGSDCAETFPEGTAVTLSATADADSHLRDWIGCVSQPTPEECTLELTADTVVTVEFVQKVTPSATLELPENDDDGSYVLSWAWEGLTMTPVRIQESPDRSFRNFEGYLYGGTGNSYQFTDKADGTYCYRLNLDSGYTEPACITVLRPDAPQGQLRITNNTSYDIVSIEHTGESSPTMDLLARVGADFLPVGTYLYWHQPPEAVHLYMANGYYPCGNRSCLPQEFFFFETTDTVSDGETTEVVFENPSIEQLLSRFSESQVWKGEYFVETSMYFAALEFFADGSWTLWSCPAFGTPQVVGQGSSVSLQSWPLRSPRVTFRIGMEPEDLHLYAADGFSSFKMTNGPESWPIVDYGVDLGGNLCMP